MSFTHISPRALYRALCISLLFGGVIFLVAPHTSVRAQGEDPGAENITCVEEEPVDQVFSATKPELNRPKLNIPIPTISFRDKLYRTVNTVCRDAEGTIVSTQEENKLIVPALCDYIQGIFKFAIGFAILLAVIVIMHNGLKWAVSAGSADVITSAKKGITDAIVGLILLLGSVLLLQLINPDLIRCRPFEIIKPKIAAAALQTVDAFEAQGLAKVKSKPGEGRFITGEMFTELGKVFQKIKDDEIFGAELPEIKGASRSVQDQLGLFVTNCALIGPRLTCGDGEAIGACRPWRGAIPTREDVVTALGSQEYNYNNVYRYLLDRFGDALDPKACAHTSGVAVDLYAPGVNQEHLVPATLNKEKFRTQEKLIEAMMQFEFCVLTGGTSLIEHWHFEYLKDDPITGQKTSPSRGSCKKPYNKSVYDSWRN